MQRQATVLVAVGGFLGAISRHAISTAASAPFPWGTLVVNVLGAFLLGVVVYESIEAGRLSTEVTWLLSTGFISSFTTYSTFAADTVGLDPALAAANVAANYVLGFGAVLLARGVVRWRL
ncbi:MAG: CrcB family protein [Natronomonas sp.]